MVTPTSLVIPFSALTADQCGVIAQRGTAAIEALGHKKIGRVLRNKLTVAVHRLNQIAARGSYSEHPTELQLDVRAIVLATDFFQIASILPSEIPDTIAADLAKALEGRLESSGSKVAEQFLSQYWFGLVVARGGLSPGVPKVLTTRTPDYVVSVDTLDVAIEVKRPESLHSAPDAMDRAASQIRDFGKPGYIALDITDVLFRPDYSVAYMDSPGKLLEVIKPQFTYVTLSLGGRASRYTRSDKYARVIGLGVFARLQFWEKPDLSQPKGTYLFSVTTFGHACSGLVVAQAEKLKRVVLSGASDVAGGAVRRF